MDRTLAVGLAAILQSSLPALAVEPAVDILAIKSPPTEHRVCIGDGAAGFVCHDQAIVHGRPQAALALRLDADPYPDLAVVGPALDLTVCPGTATGAFAPCATFVSHGGKTDLAIADLDGDADLDVVFSGSSDSTGGVVNPSHACLGHGDATFGPCFDFVDEPFYTNGLDLGDVDGDGNIDAVLATRYDRNKVCLGNGDGTFEPCSNIAPEFYDSADVALGYVDADGHLDAVFANQEPTTGGAAAPRNRICLGDGGGGFACSTIGAQEFDTKGVLLADLDGDTIVDAVFHNDRDRPTTCRGRGDGTFEICFPSVATSFDTLAIDLGDFDGDTRLDLALSDFGAGLFRCLGDGVGSFADCESFDPDSAYDFAVGEFGGPFIFADGFESGDTSSWAASVP